MQTLLLPAARPGIGSAPFTPPPAGKPWRYRFLRCPNTLISSPSSLPFSPLKTEPFSLPQFRLIIKRNRILASSPVSAPYTSPNDESEKAKLAQVAKRLLNTARYFKRLGTLGFWGQLVCTLVAAVILSFSVVITGKITSPFTFYSTAGGIAAAFISVFWSFGYLRLSERLRKTANEPSKAPPRADVVKSLKNGIVVNLLGMGAAVLGLQATVGLLVAKALTTSTNPYQTLTPGSSPVLALDVFLVQASANTIVSHFLGLAFSLELLRSVTLPSSESVPVPRVA
ncbi:protein TIC 21, chloroplastic [Solanum dulcamara]|uniref:protein TIC 21, chloroplastic n=1 Tax=Solanum dulcamara TaxID=45834 RepID=UPI002484F772|nr:protein TIC 21, chloroplastic [Solanum dulcamara]